MKYYYGMSLKEINALVLISTVSDAETKYDMQNVIRAIEGKVIEIVKQDKSIRLPKDFDLSILEWIVH